MAGTEGPQLLVLERRVSCGYTGCSRPIPEGIALKDQQKDRYFCDHQCLGLQAVVHDNAIIAASVVQIKYKK
jgi:hypothetical protein